MNTTFNPLSAMAAIALFAAFLQPAAAGPRGGGQSGKGGGDGCATRFDAIEKTELTTAETSALLYMREEEKLARDVYTTLGAKWKLQIFSNIKAAEQKHMDALLKVINLYGLKDPVVSDKVGAFTNKHLGDLYTSLVAKGKKSVIDALQVGMTIEDVDIFDLNKLLATATNDHLKMVSYNLVKGSRNHMRSFWKTLKANGGTYAAQFLTQAEIDQIVASDMERGIVYDENGDAISKGKGQRGGKGRRDGRGNGRRNGRGNGRGCNGDCNR